MSTCGSRRTCCSLGGADVLCYTDQDFLALLIGAPLAEQASELERLELAKQPKPRWRGSTCREWHESWMNDWSMRKKPCKLRDNGIRSHVLRGKRGSRAIFAFWVCGSWEGRLLLAEGYGFFRRLVGMSPRGNYPQGIIWTKPFPVIGNYQPIN